MLPVDTEAFSIKKGKNEETPSDLFSTVAYKIALRTQLTVNGLGG
jgi:hypothetical protein